MNLSNKTLLVLTGCNGDSDIVTYAKNAGAKVIATDYYDGGRAKELADFSYDVSTIDVEGILDIAGRHKIDGITTGTSEASMHTILEVSGILKIPFYTEREQLELINNKLKFKNLLISFGVPVVNNYDADLPNLEKIVKYPCIVKPADSSGAKGISICRNLEELTRSIVNAKRYSRSGEVVIEDYLQDMNEVFLNYTFIDGRASLSASFDIYRSKNANSGSFVGLPLGYVFPSKHLKWFVENVHPNLLKVFESLNIRNGTMSIQCFSDSSSFYIFEAGYRIGGAQSYIFTKILNNVSAMEMMVNFSLTGKMCDDAESFFKRDNPNFEKFCAQLNIPLRPGVLDQIHGIDELKSIPGVVNVTELAKNSSLIVSDGSLGQLGLRIHLCADNKDHGRNIVERIYSTVKFLDKNGDSLIQEKFNFNV